MTWVFVANTTYLTECTTGQPATNVAIGNLHETYLLPYAAIIDPLISSMGFGWCLTGLGLTNILGIVFVVILLKWGPSWNDNF